MSLKQRQVNIGFAMFKPKIRKLLGKKTIQEVEKDIDKSTWKITMMFRSPLTKQLWQTLFQEMTETRVKEIIFTRNQFNIFFKCVSHIHFIQLKILQLDYNDIDNIESLSFVDMPHLQYLSLINNHITSLKSYFTKSLFPNLTKIHFQRNPIFRIENISKLSILHKNITKNKFQMSGQSIFQTPVNQDLSFLAKIEINCTMQTGSFSKFLMKQYFQAIKEFCKEKSPKKYHFDKIFSFKKSF